MADTGGHAHFGPEGHDRMGPDTAQSGRRLERWVLTRLCEPLLPRLPAGLHPNRISLVTHALGWSSAAAAVASPHLSSAGRSVALVLSGCAMLAAMVGDCLDGMHARRTGQCSRLGELLDHGLDTMIVPLSSLTAAFALQMPNWGLSATAVTATMVYHAQLLLHHERGQFLHPDSTSGVEAQLGTGVGLLALAGVYQLWPPDDPAVQLVVLGLAAGGTLVQLRINGFYYARLSGSLMPHAYFVATCAVPAVLLLCGVITRELLALLLVAVSFRLSGSYVLHTLVGDRFSGVDRGLSLWLLAILAAASFPPTRPLATHLAWLLCPYIAARNALDCVAQRARLAQESVT